MHPTLWQQVSLYHVWCTILGLAVNQVPWTDMDLLFFETAGRFPCGWVGKVLHACTFLVENSIQSSGDRFPFGCVAHIFTDWHSVLSTERVFSDF